MTIQRVEIDSISGPKHGPVILEGKVTDKLPKGNVYVNPTTGETKSGSRGDQLRHLKGGELEIPRSTWYGG